MNLGELIVELSADSSELEKTLERAKKKAYEAAMSVEKSFEKINLNINVDDDSLTDLNKHLNLKVQHLKEVNKYFNNNPIVVNIDDSQLTDLNKHLHIKVQHLKEVNKYYDSNPIKINTDTTRLDDLEERLGKLTNKTITITVESDLSNQLEKSLVAAVKEAVKDGMQESSVTQQQQASKEASSQNKVQNVNVVASPGRAVLEGIFDGLGKGFTQGINKGIEDAVGVDIPTMTRISSNMMLRYFGVGKKAQSDPKNEQKRVEAILKDGINTFIKVHDSNVRNGYSSSNILHSTTVPSSRKKAFTPAKKANNYQSILDDDVDVDFEAAGNSAAKGLLRYFGVGKKAQSDPKNEQKRVEAILKGMVNDYTESQVTINPSPIGQFLAEINNEFANEIERSLGNVAQKAKSATISAVKKGSQSILANSSQKVQNAVNDIFTFLEGDEDESISIGQIVGNKLTSVAKQSLKSTAKTVLPNTYGVVSEFLGSGTIKPPKPKVIPVTPETEIKQAAANLQNATKGLNEYIAKVNNISTESGLNQSAVSLENAAQSLTNAANILTNSVVNIKQEVVSQVPMEQPLNIPLVIPEKSKKEKEPELALVENTTNIVSPPLKKYIQDVKESTLNNIELSKQYAQATAKENNSPLALDIKKKQDISLKDVKAKFDAIKKYFAEEYKRLLLEFNEVKLTGTVEDIKAVKNKLIAFKSASKSAIADIDATVKEAEKAGYDKKINSPLTEIHRSGKQGISSNANEAGRKANQLKNEEVNIFNKQLEKYVALAEENGIDVVEGLKKGIANKSSGVSDQARKMLDDLIETIESRMKIQSPSLVMFEIGMMIASGLFLGMQKGNSQVAVGARQLVGTIKDAVGSAKEILEPALAIGGVIPGVSTAATIGSVGLAATDSGLKMLDKIGERHAANPDQTLFQSAFGSGKDFITELRADKTLTKPREAFDHFINLSKAGAATLGVNSFTTFDAAQAGMTALLRSSAAGKAIVQSHGETKYRLAQDPSLDYMTTYKAILTDKLKDLKLTKPEIVKAIGSALKVVPTGFGTAANSVAETAGTVLADGIDALTIPRNLYRNISSKTAQGVTHQQAIAESITDLGAPAQVANAIGSFGDKHSTSLNTFARMSGNVVENINRTLINTVAASSKVVSSGTNAVSNQIKKNMGHGLPGQQLVAQPSSQSISSAAVASNNVSAKSFAFIGGNIMRGLGKGMADGIGGVTKVVDNAGSAIQNQIKQNMGIQSPSKVMIALGLMIASGLAVGIKKGVIDVSAASEMLTGAVDDGIKELNLFLSEDINNFNGVIENSLGSASKTTLDVYNQSSKNTKKSLIGSLIGTAMVALSGTGVLPKSIETPVRHLGAYYQGNVDVIKLNNEIAKQAEIATAFSIIKDYHKTGSLPKSGTVGYTNDDKFNQLTNTLGGFNYDSTQDGRLIINDVYDWNGSTDSDGSRKTSSFNLPMGAGQKLFSIFDKVPLIPKLLGFVKEVDGSTVGFSKFNKETGKVLLAITNEKTRNFHLGHEFHSVMGGKPYIQTHEVDKKRTEELLILANNIYKETGGNQKRFFNHPEVSKYLQAGQEQQQSPGLLNQLLPAIKKDFGSNTILGNLFNSATNAFGKGGNLKDIGINFIGSFGKGILASSGGVLGIVTAFAKGILSAIKKVFRIASPSGEGIDVGENIAGSTGTGIDNQAHRAVEAARNMAEDISEAMIPDPWDMRFSANPVFQQDLDLENQAQAQIRATREHLQKSMIQGLLSNAGVNFGSDFNHEGIASSVLSSSQLIKYLNNNFANLNPFQQMGFRRLADDFDNQKTNAAHQFAIARTSGTTLDSATIRGFDSSFNTILNRIVAFSKQLGIKSTEIDRLLASNQSRVTAEVYQPPRFVAPKTSIPERQSGQTDQEYSEIVKRALAEDNNNYRAARNAYNRMILGVSDTPVPQKTQFPMLPPVPVYAREIIDNVPSVAYTTPDPWNNSVQSNLQKFVEQVKPQSILPPAKAYRDINLLLTSTQSNLQKLGRDIVSSQLRTQLPQQNLPQAFVPVSNSGVQQLLLPPAKAYKDVNLLLTSTQSNLQKLGRDIVSSQLRTQLPQQQTQLPPQRITSPLILPNSVVNNPNAKLILPKTATPRPDAQIISPQNFTANPNAQLILPVVQGLIPAVRSTHSLTQNSISTLTNTNKQIRVNLDALRSGNKNLVFSRYTPIPDPSLAPSPTAQASRQSTMQPVNRSNQLPTGQISATLPSAILSFISQNPPTAIPSYSVPTVRQNIKSIASQPPNIPPVPTITASSSQPPNIPPVPPITASSSQPQPPNIPPTLMNQYLSLGTDLVTNMFKAVNTSIRQSTLSGYASLGQVMRNAVNAALFSLADTLKKPLHQALMSQTRSILPWFLRFIPKSLQLIPKLSMGIPFVGGIALRFGNSIIKNLLENNILKEGGFLTNLLSSITRINLSALSGTKISKITSFLGGATAPVNGFIASRFEPFLSLGLGAASPLYDAFSGILGLDESIKPNPKKQAPTVEKVLQNQTKANREKAKIRDFAGAKASKELVETLGNTLVDNVLESLDIPLIPKSAVQIMMGKKLGQRSATIADSINALGVQKSKTEQLLERAVQSGKATPERIDRLTRMALRERGIGKSARNAMTADELAVHRENILNNSLNATKKERDFLQFEGDLEANTIKRGFDATKRTRDAKLIRILRERGVSNADIRNIRQSSNGLNNVATDLVNNPRTTNKGFVGKLTEAYAANDQDAMKELVKQGLRKTGMSSKQIDNIDPKLLDTATAGIMTTLSGLQAKFKEKGFNMGKALAKGFKDSMVNLANAKDDLEYNAKKALGQANFGDSVGLIFRRMFRGTVATQDQFKEMYNQMGAGVKKALFRDPKEGDEMFPNILQFFGSIGTTLAPITTMVGAITPLLLPLAPIITGIGMSVNMVMPHIARLIDGIQRVEILQRRFKFLGGSAEGGQAEFNYAKDMASKYNVPSEVAANSYSQLAIAARDSKMEGQGVKELFEGITASLSALGITGQDASLVFMAYTQILSKGKLSMEELRQQLGEKFPPAMGVFAKAMGVSIPEMNALVSSGGILSQDILPKVAKVLKEDYGDAAADQAGGLVVALNKLGNVGFEITTIFTDKLGGTLGFFVGSFADILGVLSGALKELIPLGQSFMIGFAATISIGLTILLSKFKPLMVAIGSLKSFLLATFSAITTNMMPMIIGVTADVADGWMGAEKNLMDNMIQGITNMFVSIFGNIDSIMRSMSGDQVSFTSMFGGLIQGAKEAGNIVEWLKGIFAGFFKIIPAGFVELLAMVFMFEQGTGLAVMALGPAIKGLWGGLAGMLKSIWGAFQGVMNSLKGLNELMMTSMGLANAAGHGAEEFTQRRVAALNATLAFLRSALMHVAIAYGILMFSKGDFSDPMRESINKNTADINKHLTEVRVNINKTTEAFNKATKSVSELGNGIRNALPAKGIQLDIRSLWGGGDWKWDDAVRDTNRKVEEKKSPGFMDVVGTSALAAGGVGAAIAAGSAITSSAAAAQTIIAANAALVVGPKAAIPLLGRFALALAPVVTAIGPIGLAIAGFVTALLVAAAALDLFAPKLTKEQYRELPQEIKDIINVKDYKRDRLDLASQQVIKLHKDQVLSNQRLAEFAKSVGLDGNINKFIAPPVKVMPEKQRKEFEKTDSANNINREITSTKDRLKGIENIGRTDVEKSAQRDKPIYKGVQEKLAQLEKNKRLLELQFMVNYGNKGEIDNLQNNIAKQTLVVKELQMREAQIKKEEIQFSVFGRPSFSGTGQTFKYAKKEQNYAEESQKLKALQQQKAQLQTNLNATVQRRLDFDQIKTIDVRLKKAVDEFINLDEQLNLKPNDELRSKVGLKKELIKQLRKQREKLLDSFGDPTPWLKKALKSTTDEIAQTQARADITEGQRKNIINNLRVRQEQLEKMLATVSKFGDISDLTGALYTKASNALRDAETKYNTDISKNKVASNQAQTRIYSRTNLTAQQIAPDLSNQQINDLAFQQKALEKSIATKITSLREYRAVLALGPSDPGAVQAEIDKLQQDILKDKEQISQNILDIAKARRDANQVLIDQTKQVAEYYRTSVREAETATIEYKKAIVSIRNQQFANRLRQALIGAGNNIVTEFVDTLINLFQQLSDIENINIDQQKQKLDYRNSIQDIEIKATELQRSLPGKIIPFDSNKINQYNQQLKGVGGTVLDINKEIQRINKILGMDAVNSTMGFNNALEKVVFTLTKIKNLAPSIPNPGDNIPKNKNNFYVPYKSINNPGKKPDPFNGLSLPTKSSNVPSLGAIASTPKEMLVAGITSDVGYLPAVGKSPYLIAQATTPKSQQPKAIPSNAIVSPVSGKNISEFVRGKYGKGWNSEKNQSIRILGDANVLATMTGTLKKINGNTVELQRSINGKDVRFRYVGLNIGKNIKFNEKNLANVKAGQLIGTPILDAKTGQRLFDFSASVKDKDGKTKFINAQKFYNNIVELKRVNPLTKFFNWATGNHIDPAVQGLNLAPQNVDPSWFKQVTSFMARPTMQNVERLQQAAKVTQKVVQSLQGKGSPNSSQGGIVLKVPAGKPTTKRKTTTRKTTTNPKPKTTTRKTTTNPKVKTVQEKSRELTERANRGGTDSPNNNQRNVTGATNIKAGATRQNTEAQIQVTEEQKRKAVIDFLRGLSTNTIKAQNDLDDANLTIKQRIFDREKLSVSNNPKATEEQKDQIAYMEKNLEFERIIVDLRKRLRNLQAPPLSDTDFDRIQKELSKKGINVNIGFLKKLYLQLRSANAQEAATITANLRDLEKQRPQWLKDFAQQQRLQREVTKLNRRSDNLGIDTGVLQTQLGLLKQIETSRPLDPKVLEIPKIEYQLGIMQAEDEKLKAQANLTQLMKDKPGIFTPQDFKKRVEAIDKTYNLKLATLKLQFDTNDLSQKLKDEMNKLDAKIFLEEPTFKNLELQGKLFTATAAEGMVDLVNIYNQSLIDQRNATNRYEKEINETKGNRLLDEKQKDQRIKDIQENMALEKKVINETADRAFRKGTLQNQKLLLDVQIKMSDSAKALLEGKANIAKNLGLDLAAERIDKQVAELNLANEYKQRKIQVEQDVENLKLSDEDANTLRSNLDAEMSLKTKVIQSQYSELSQVIKSFVGGFKNSFKEFLLSTDDTGKAFEQLLKGLGKSVLDALAEIASKYMTDALFSWLQPPSQQLTVAAQQLIQAATALNSAAASGMGSTFSPNGLPGDEIFTLMGSGSGIGSFTSGFQFPDVSQLGAADFGSLDLGGIDFSGFAKGGMITEDTLGKIENFANGGIIGAMSKERSLTGRTPHLVVASEGERILNHKETAIWNRLQSGVAGFADGGIVGGKGEIASRIGSTTTVNVPVSVSVSNDSEVDSNRLSQTIQALVSDGIRRELRPGGSIDRGNPYRR